jgi:hypothetical protein
MASSSGETVDGAVKNPQKYIDDLLAHLDLREDELEDVVIGADEVIEPQKEARWLAIAMVHTSRSFSSDAFMGKMKAIWNLSIDPICREAGECHPDALPRRLEKGRSPRSLDVPRMGCPDWGLRWKGRSGVIRFWWSLHLGTNPWHPGTL